MKVGEITRIIIISIVGALALFVVQPLLYSRQIIFLQDVDDIASWVSDFYIPGSVIVFCASILAMILWCVLAATTNEHRGDQLSKWQLIWWLIGLLPLFSIFIAIGFFKGNSDDALFSLTLFYVLDALWLYWITTATSTSGNLMYLPPLSREIRDLIGAK